MVQKIVSKADFDQLVSGLAQRACDEPVLTIPIRAVLCDRQAAGEKTVVIDFCEQMC
jgi:hypothetical protein